MGKIFHSVRFADRAFVRLIGKFDFVSIYEGEMDVCARCACSVRRLGLVEICSSIVFLMH